MILTVHGGWSYFSETVVKYSVKTCHPYFYNQLYHGVDEYGLAGSWLSGNVYNTCHVSHVLMFRRSQHQHPHF